MTGSYLRPVGGRCLSRLAFLTLAAACLGWGLFVTARIELAGHRDDSPRSDALVVLGAAQYQGIPSPVFQARLDHALELYEEGKAPLVVVAGAKLAGDRYTEARAGVRYLRSKGVPERSLLAVGSGDDTLTSLQAVAEALREREKDEVIIVSDRFHIFRSMQIASDLGLRAHGSPTTTSPVDEKPGSRARYTLREVAAYTAYRLTHLLPGSLTAEDAERAEVQDVTTENTEITEGI